MNHPNLVRRSFFLLTLTALLFGPQLRSQEKQIDNALLWKVTGKSLLKPSFLFGTIHLQDQRVFNFNDSLYRFIQAADGFAMEIHPDSIISAVMQKADESANDKLLKKHLKKDEFDQLSRKLKRDGIDADKLTLREAYILRDHLSKPEPRDDDMPTFVDAYLFGVARNQGKEIVGLEQASDQLNLLDDIKGEIDVKELLKARKKEKTLTERLIQLYIREDLRAIQQMMAYLPAETEDKLLTLRNHGMVSKMDSLIQSKSFVVAVGTAHLPGKSGMIELLRQKGYTVEPVFTTSRTHANKYAIKAAQKSSWVEVNEPLYGYSIRMPGKPSPMDLLNGSMKMNTYMDLTTMKVYYTAFVVPGISVTKQNADSVLESMSYNALTSSNGERLSSRRFSRDEFEGIDFVYRQASDKMFARVQALALGKRVYLIAFASPKKEDLHTREAEEYYKGFALHKMPELTWESQTFNDLYFKISMPSKGKVTKLPVSDSTITSYQINSMDNNRGTYYGVTVVTANAAYVVPDDSLYFQTAMERLEENMEIKKSQKINTTYKGFNASHIKALLKDDLYLNCLMIGRGNRVYNLMVISNAADSAHIDSKAFFDSFSFLEYPKLTWEVKKLDDLGIYVPLTGSFSKTDFLDNLEDKPAGNRKFQFVSYDRPSATSFFITRSEISELTWANHDSVILKKYMRDLVDANEKLVDYRFVKNGKVNGVEFNISKPNTTLVQRLRVLLNGNSLYMLQTDVPALYWKSHDYSKFFDEFRFEKHESTDYLKKNSFETLLAALRSTDSAKHSKAYEDMEDMFFDASDASKMVSAMCSDFVLDTLHYYSTGHKFGDALVELKNDAVPGLIEKKYRELKPSEEKYKFLFLNVLGRIKTEDSYSAIHRLLKTGIPQEGESTAFGQSLRDSLDLSKRFYPEILRTATDTILGSNLFWLHCDMIDSNKISIDQFRAHQPILLQAARNHYTRMVASKEDEYTGNGYYAMIKILGSLNTDSSIKMLKRMSTVKQVNVKYHAALKLLQSGHAVEAGVLDAIAADKYYRLSLYNELKDLKKLSLFPLKHLNQKSFAEAYLYNSFDEEYPDVVSFIGEKVVNFKGAKRKLFLYRITFEYDGEKSSYLGISGCFDATGKSIDVSTDVSGIYWDEQFKQSQIESLVKTYLSQVEM